MKKNLAYSGIGTRDLPLSKLSRYPLRNEMKYLSRIFTHLNVDRVEPKWAIKTTLHRVQRSSCSKMFRRVFHLINSLQLVNVLLGKQQNDTNII